MSGDDAVLGVDGCPGGWVGALVRGGRTAPADVRWCAGSIEELLALPARVVAIDIPIGLPRGAARRACDLEARLWLGAQRSSVFLTPPRATLGARDHAEASALSRAAGSVGVSLQTFHLLPKVREVEEAVRAEAGADRVIEVHPEVAFRALTGRVLPPKRTAAGRAERLDALRTWLPSAALPSPRPGRAAADDCLDALVCAWSAQRWACGTAHVLGGDTDATGLPMRIVV